MATYNQNKYYKILQQSSAIANNIVSILRELLAIRNYCQCPSYGESLLINTKIDFKALKIRFDELTLYEFCNDYPHDYYDILDATRSRIDTLIASISILEEIAPCCDPTSVCEFVSVVSKIYADSLIIKSDCYFLIRYAQVQGGCQYA